MENNQYLKTDRDVYIKFEFQVFWVKINLITLSLSGSYHQLEWEPSGLRWKARPLAEKTEGSWTGPSSLFHHLYNGFEFSTSTLKVEVYIEPVPVTRDTHLEHEWAVYTRMWGLRATESLTLSWERSCEWGVHTSRDKELFSDLRVKFYLNRLIFLRVLMHVQAPVSMQMHVYMCVHASGGQRTALGFCPQTPPTCFETQSLHSMEFSNGDRLGWATNPTEAFCLCLPSAEIQKKRHHALMVTQVLGTGLRSLCL